MTAAVAAKMCFETHDLLRHSGGVAEPSAVIRLYQGAAASTLDQSRLKSTPGAFFTPVATQQHSISVFLNIQWWKNLYTCRLKG